MKRILFYLFLLFCIIILLPTIFVLCIREKKEPEANASVPLVKVKHADTGDVTSENIESYLYGVVAAEMPASFHIEALKAQAVAARTYIYNKMLSDVPNPDHPDADVCTDSKHCKAWLSDAALHQEMGEEWYADFYPKICSAVNDTCGEIVTYDDQPIVAVFHSAGGGRTENAVDVWGGDVPYLKSVESAGDASSPKFYSEKTVSKENVCRTLCIDDAHVYGYTHSEGGAVLTVDIGGSVFRGTDIRKDFELSSANFSIEETDDSFVFHVKGSGHGVGLSQYGANSLAENGDTYDVILKTYYTGVSLSKAW